MKTLLQTLLFFLLATQICFGQWYWQNPLPQGNDLLSVYFINYNTGWAVGGAGTILKTTNAGNNWVPQSSGTTEGLNSVYFTDSNTGWAVGGNGTILKTTNGGINWISQSSGTMEALNSVYLTDSNTGWVVGGVGTIIKTTNGGINWFQQTSGTTTDLNSVHFTDSNTGWAGGEGGTILHTTNGGVTFIDNEPTQPTDFILSQNYPNPFNPSTVISYQLPVSSDVTINVYDILGNEIATLVDEYKPAGRYEAEFNASSLPSGVYFYQLKTSEFVQTRKMILMK